MLGGAPVAIIASASTSHPVDDSWWAGSRIGGEEACINFRGDLCEMLPTVTLTVAGPLFSGKVPEKLRAYPWYGNWRIYLTLYA